MTGEIKAIRLKAPKGDKPVIAGEPQGIVLRASPSRSPELSDINSSVPDSPSFLATTGSALHTLGSVLNWPSRLVHGTINAATGGEGGFGNLNPVDSTGGIEASQHLVRAGIMPANNPNEWELSDLARGAADIAGDPTTWIGLGGMTRAGNVAAKSGSLAKGFVPQIAAGQRALLTARVPFGDVIGELGTGTGAASALTKLGNATRVTPLAKSIANSEYGRIAKGLFDARMRNTTRADLQSLMPQHAEALANSKRKIDALVIRVGREVAKESNPTATSKVLHSVLEGVTDISALPPKFHRPVNELKNLYRRQLRKGIEFGTGYAGPLNDPALRDATGNLKGFASRYKTNLPSTRHLSGSKTVRAIKRKDMLKGFTMGTHADGGVNDVLSTLAKAAHSPGMAALSRADKITSLKGILTTDPRFAGKIIPTYDKMISVTRSGKKVAKAKTFDRLEQLAEYAIDNPGLATQNLFGNEPLADILRGLHRGATRGHSAELVSKALAGNIGYAGPDATTLDKALKSLGYRSQIANKIAASMGTKIVPNHLITALSTAATKADHDAAMKAIKQARHSFMSQPVDPDLISELKMTGSTKAATPASSRFANQWQQGLNLFKSGILAFPSSRFRDLFSGAVKNLLNGWGFSNAYAESARLMNGELLKGDYRHLDFVKNWFKKSGLDISKATPDQQTEAVRQMVAVHLPREHGLLGDLPKGATGTELKDVLVNVPGQHKSTLNEQFVTGPLRELTDPSTAGQARSWNPLAVRGVGGRTDSAFRPVRASEQFSEASDQLNRNAGFLHQVNKGTHERVAAKNVNRAQVDYDPETYSDLEKNIKRNFAPFYSFTSRSVPETVRQLADFGSPTSHLIKSQTRAYNGDASIPEYVLDSSGVPLGQSDDGTKRFLTGLGLMHEPGAKIVGQLASGDLRGAAANVLSGANPFIIAPAEQIFGTSLFREGEPLRDLESNTGRLLSNIGVLSGMREPGAGPVSYPGKNAVDVLTSMTPVGRLLSTMRQLTDTRRGIGKVLTQDESTGPASDAAEILTGALPAITGLRYTDVSPQRQIMMLRRRAEELARESGAKSSQVVYFPSDQIELLRKSNPDLADRQEALQKYINSLRLMRKK